MPKKTALFALMLIVMSAVVSVVEADNPNPVVAEIIPAPIGYVFAFSPPYPGFIYGFRNIVGTYTPYRADIRENGIYVVRTDDYRVVSTIVHADGSSQVRIVEPMPLLRVYGLNFEGSNDMIIFGEGIVYLSRYYIVYGTPTEITPLTVVVNEHLVDLNKTVIKVLAITTDGYITVYPPKGPASSVRLTDLIGAPEACVAWFKDVQPGFPWLGGIIISPACIKNIEVLKTVEYAGRLFAVVFRIPNVPAFGGKIDYVVMGHPSARVLSEAGLVVKARITHPGMHIITGYDLSYMNVYLATGETGRLLRGEVYPVKDMTQVINQERGAPKRMCSIPSRATILFRLLWSNKQLTGTVELLPGEIILYVYEKSYYVCQGEMGWVERGDPPLVKGPVYQEFLHPITVYTTTGLPVLVITSNGKIYYGPSVEIPFELYASNVILWYSGRYRGFVELSITSIFTSAFFVILLIILVVIFGLVLFSRRKEAPEKITIVWDVKPPPPLTLAEKDVVEQTIKKHVDSFGVCPDILDLPLYYEILPPIPKDVGAEDEVILCPFKTNTKTESVLREIAGILQTVLWGTQRLWKNRGYFYTTFGDEMLYMYFYKQEDEDRPEYILANALEAVVRSSSFETTLFRRPLGLVIIVEQDMLPFVKRELSYLEELSLVPSGEEIDVKAKSYNVRGYLTSRNVSTNISVERIQEVIDREVPKILVVSRANIHELIEYLAEKSVKKGDEYMRKGLGEEL